ncbi:MAG: 3-deoxy-D-manno-octulosonic acid transferase [Fusobacteriaceae bacterium]
MLIFFYNFIRYIFLYPIIFLISLVNRKKRKFFLKRFFQDISFLKKEPTIMFHCSSMGETNLADPLIRKLLKDRKEKILISVFTDTGYENVKTRYSLDPRVEIIKFPLDDYILVKNFIKKIDLKMLLVVETEIWPNLITEASKKGKVIFINGRISDKSIDSYRKFRFFLNPLFKKIDYFFMQSQNDSERIISLGATVEKVENIGNLKFSINFENYSDIELGEIKNLISAEKRKIYVFGSTREEEESKIIPYLKDGKEGKLIVIVPRHLHRVEEIEGLVESYGFSYNKFSDLLKNEKEVKKDILIVDMMGVLRKFYALGDIVFVGGTLVDVGGHSLLEPLFYGKTPIFGPYLNNVKDISRELLDRELGYKIKKGDEFPILARAILDSGDKKEEIRKLFKENSDTLEKIVEKIEKMI